MPAIIRLRRYLTYGGFLFIDSAEGRAGGAFDQSVRALLARVLPGDLPQRLDEKHVLWKSFYMMHDRPFGRILAAREPLLLNQAWQWESLAQSRIGKHAKSFLGVPIMVGDRAIGVISVQST